MQSGRGGLLHCFETFFGHVDGKKMAFVSVIELRRHHSITVYDNSEGFVVRGNE